MGAGVAAASAAGRKVGRVRGRRAFEELRREGVRRRSGPLTVTWAPVPAASASMAFAIGRQVGSAVVRNRLRRQLRAAARSLDLPPGRYLVSVRSEAVGQPFSQLRAWLEGAVASFPPPPRGE